jgi:serine/threonine protein kinase
MKTCPTCGGSYERALKFCPRDGEVLEDAPRELTGQVLDGQYEIEALIARGGMGTVYRARHILLGDRVAIKTLKPEMQADSDWLRRFRREAQAARRFRHPNSVTVYDLRTSADGLVYMVMEFVEGETLDRELSRRDFFTPAEALAVLEPVARVLEVAHAQGVVHRDLKPENVMIAHDACGTPQIKLLDLGIAKLRDMADARPGESGQPALTIAGQILGTPYYMSPEQWGELQRDGHPEIDGRADIYSLGVMFYELLTGRRPFGGRTLAEFRHAHVVLDPPPLSEAAPGVPERFALAVVRAMAKDRGDRFPTAGEFVEELRAALELRADGRARTLMHADSLPSQTLARGYGEQTSAGARRDTVSPEDGSTAPTALFDDADSPAAPEPDPRRRARADAGDAPACDGLISRGGLDGGETGDSIGGRLGARAGRDAGRDQFATIADPALATHSAEHVRTQGDAARAPVAPTTPLAGDASPQASRAESSRVEAGRAEASRAESSQADVSRAEASRAEASRAGGGVSVAGRRDAAESERAGGDDLARAAAGASRLGRAGVSQVDQAGLPRVDWNGAGAAVDAAHASGVVSPGGVSSGHAAASRAAARAASAGGGGRRRVLMLVSAVALLLVVWAGVAGVFAWRRWQASRAGVPVAGTTSERPDVSRAAGAGESAARGAEVLSYWIETFEDASEPSGERVARAGAITLDSGQQFKFHFSPRERGYFYVVGPGRANAPMTFLTAQPVGVLNTNLAAADSDFSFPYGPGRVLELDRNPGTEEYTVIFSNVPLLSPAFLAAPAHRELSPAEQRELEGLRARAQTAAPAFDVKDTGGGPAVAVYAPGGAGAWQQQQERLIVFDIRIEHR